MKVSVCMATYNGEKYIKKQIESIISQLSVNDELIISDDNSTDGTLRIAESFNDSRIKIYCNLGEKGHVSNFENALKKATGEIIFLSDQDDEWLPGKVEKCKKKLKEYDLVVTDAKVVDKDYNIIRESLFYDISGKKVIKTGLINNFIKNRYFGCCMAFHRKILEKILPFPPKYNYYEHDTWIPYICEMYYNVDILDEPLLLYRRHGGNISCFERSTNSFLKKIILRVYPMIYSLMRKRNNGDRHND